MNFLERYKKWSQKQYDKHLDWYDFKPFYKWNLFDCRNDWVYDLANGMIRKFIFGWQGIGYAWEAWSHWMRDMKYSYKLPNAMWDELNDGWIQMYSEGK